MRMELSGLAFLRVVSVPVSLPVNLAALFWKWRHNTRSRTALRNLPPHLFNDVGLTSAQAEAESLKRFWMR